MTTNLITHVYINPLAYNVFPQLYYPIKSDSTTEYARYVGYLRITDEQGTTVQYYGTKEIDLSGFVGYVEIENITDRGSVKLGKWYI